MQILDTVTASVAVPGSIALPLTLSQGGGSSPSSPLPLILLGRDERGRPHASRFVDHETAAVANAAGLMGFSFIVAETPALKNLAERLPAGRLFPASGRAFVPFISAQTFSQLLAAAGLPDAPMPFRGASKPAGGDLGEKAGSARGDTPGGAGGAAKPPFDWPDIGIGSLVLATTGGPQEGWFEAVVVYTKADDYFELRWRDFPLDGNISRHRHQLALLHPGTVG
ncbi:hypothetical protein [Methylobacterium sp. A54F]